MRTAWWWVATWTILLKSPNTPTSLAVPLRFCRSVLQETYGTSAKTRGTNMDTLSNSASSQVANGLTQALASTQVATKASIPLPHYLTKSFQSTTSMVQLTSTSQTWTLGIWNVQISQPTKMRWSTPLESASDVTSLTILLELHALLHRGRKLNLKLRKRASLHTSAIS